MKRRRCILLQRYRGRRRAVSSMAIGSNAIITSLEGSDNMAPITPLEEIRMVGTGLFRIANRSPTRSASPS